MKVQKTGMCYVRGTEISYWLTEGLSQLGGCTFGIIVEREGERTEYRDLSSSCQEVLELLETLARCRVTPVTVSDVVEDWLLR